MQTVDSRDERSGQGLAARSVWLSSRTACPYAFVINFDTFTFKNWKEKRSYATGEQGVAGERIAMLNKKVGVIVCLGVAAILMMTAFPARAQTINNEHTETWNDLGNSIVHGVTAADIDGDGVVEIITVGETLIGNPAMTKAQLRIWNWTGTTLFREKTYEWQQAPLASVTVAYGVFAGDLDGDNDQEIAVVGKTGDANGYDWMIRVFTWDGTTLTSYSPGIVNAPGEAYRAVYAANLVGDSKLEIIAVGDRINNPHDGGVWLWSFDGSSLGYLDSYYWGSNNDIVANGVSAGDVDGDGVIEFVTVGYYKQSALTAKQGQLRIWNYVNSQFTVEKEENINENGQLTTEWYGVYLGDVDYDSTTEIVVTGYGYDDTFGVRCNNGVLRIWTWTGIPRVLSLELNRQWPVSGSDTISYSVYAKSFAGNYQQIVSGGKTTVSGTDYAQLKIWNWTGAALNDVASTTWATNNRNTAVNSVYIKDVDSDSKLEILSGGQTYDGNNWNSQLRISNLTW